MPSLGMITINALACADSVLIPVQVSYLPVKGLQQLIKTITRVKKQINPGLEFEGMLLTMVDFRTNYAKDIAEAVKDTTTYTMLTGSLETYTSDYNDLDSEVMSKYKKMDMYFE